MGAQTGDDTQLPTGLHLGLGVNVGSTSRNFMQGSLANTGNALDIAVNGQGFFQIQMPDGTEVLTRDKPFRLPNHGRLAFGHSIKSLPDAVFEFEIDAC